MKKQWWRDFFDANIAELIFEGKQKQTEREVRQVLGQAKPRRGSRILDLACGTGRHSHLLAKKGFQVTGLDFSETYIKMAQQKRRNAKKLDFVQGDMRRLERYFPEQSFDLIISLYNSFGYLEKRKDDFNVLKQIAKLLKPCGALVLNTISLSGAEKRLAVPFNHGYEVKKNLFLIDQAKLNRRKKEIHSSWVVVDARKTKTQIHRKQFRQNIYSHSELKKRLLMHGLRVESLWGQLQGGQFTKASWHQSFVARRVR